MHNEIPYIETLPSHWKVIQNRFLFYYDGKKVGDKYTDYQLLSLTTEGVKEKDISATGGKVPASYDTYQTVKKGQMIFCLFDLDCSAVFSGISHYDGMITSAYDVFSSTGKMENGFADYWFRYVFFNRYYKMFSKSIRYTITGDIFRSIKTPVPPLNEQRIISEYLNHKCSQIDALIANTGTQIAKLKQYKQSLITEAVTKGLDPTVPMKDSGVEWIGKIPESWSVRKFKFATTIHEEKYTSGNYQYIALENIESFSGKYIHSDSIYDLVGSKIANTGDVIFGKLRPYLGKVFEITEKVCVSNEFAIFHGKLVNSHYLKYYMINSCFVNHVTSSTYGTKMPRAHINFISSCFITVPSPTEQEQIVHFLDSKCSQIDRLIEVKQSKIEKLEEYKKSLIYEYVTGKKEVEHG